MVKHNRMGMLVNVVAMGLMASVLVTLRSRSFAVTLFGSTATLVISGGWQIGCLLLVVSCAGVESVVRSHPLARGRGLGYTLTFWGLPGLLTVGGVEILLRTGFTPVGLVALVLDISFLGLAAGAQYWSIDPDHSLQRRARFVLVVLAYLTAYATYLLIFAAEYGGWLVSSGVAVVSVLLGLELLRGTAGSVPRTWLYGVVVGLLMSQAALAVGLWNVSDTVGALVLLLVFYLLIGLAHHALWDRVTKRVLAEYAITTIAALAALWFYANWST